MNESKVYECLYCGIPVAATTVALLDVLSPSTLERFSKTNQSLPPIEFDNVSKECQNLSQGISSIESQILRLQASMESLRKEQERLRERLEAYKPLIHPIRRLPDEVLAYVFRICVDMDVEELQRKDSAYCQRYPGSLDTRKAPWVLGQICRKWRLLALSLPQLWTVFDLDWRYDDLLWEYHQSLDVLLSIQLQRSRDQPLTVTYCGLRPSSSNTPRSSNGRLLLTLCSRSFQWSKATIRADAESLQELSHYKGMFPYLTDLHVHFLYPGRIGWARARVNKSVFDTFFDTPKLRRLTITGYIEGLSDLSVRFPWAQITHYAVHNDTQWFADLEDHFSALSQMKNLEYCSLETSIPSDGILIPSKSPALSHLHTLVLSHRHIEIEESAIDPLLDWLTLPSLRTLRLTCGLDSPSSLLSFIQRSQCTIEQLAILRSVMDDGALVRLLSADCFNHVHTLELGGTTPLDLVNISDTVIRALEVPSPTSTQSILVPRLRTLVLHDEKAWSDGVFLDMVTSRREVEKFNGTVARLERLVLQDAVSEGENAIKDPEMVLCMEELCRSGLVFEARWTCDSEDYLY
ncbi:hypothetical protein E1B28_009587 [Marasmius oreades]|uniref:F-box domain-containing protein n=1 Tax=Marasmius oreades TaxID=181124 RepID=A0A9P7RW07_9AGAR|nr:uncharacterized protein E1B28_009587 [Marasmius oreades]KAG7090473.1 hypothetical protein E1B28_009587 [Marasmius oreades]